ncbi:MAG: potassium-transporting ATPase subunit KdpA [Phycisphaerae bacterium]
MNDIVFLVFFFLLFIGLALPMGRYQSRVYQGERNFLSALLHPVERFIYRLCGIDARKEMNWKGYVFAFLAFNGFGLIFLFLIQVCQGGLPLNPQKLPGVRWDLAINTAISFVTNTNWQSYGGETTMSYLTQMLGLTVQNFVSAAAGICPMLALARGFTNRGVENLGNFWVDLTRAVLYVLLPLSFVVSIILASQGVVQTLRPPVQATTLEGKAQTIAVGPVASQIAIKQLGSNGGGFFNVNSCHPFENPNQFTNFIETISILLLPVSLVFTFGYMLKKSRQGWAFFQASMILFVAGLILAILSEVGGNPILAKAGIAGGLNMEGKETRFGLINSVLWGQATTVTSNGSVNAMHDSMLPLTGLVYLFNMGIGEVIFGGVGVGMIGLVFYAILTMFIAGLMIGKTPELFGKKLGIFEMVMTVIALVGPAVFVLLFSALATITPFARSMLNNPSSHGLSEILYAYSSALGNNGSAFAGLNANNPFYNWTLGLGMLIGRFATILPAIAIAGVLSRKQTVFQTEATFPTTGPLFVGMLIAVIVVMGALTFLPVYALGPILEHLFMQSGKAF